MFQLTEIEYESSRSQFVTLNKGRGFNLKYLPFVFTEYGVLMLSSVINSEKAIQTNIQIMRLFVKIKQMLTDTTEIKIDILQIQKQLENHDKNIELVFSYIDELTEKKTVEKPRNKIGYKK